MGVHERFLTVLDSDSRETFLLTLGHRLGVSARGIFVSDAPDGLRQAQACNEMMIALWAQARAQEGEEGAPGYPDADFLSVLLEKADAGDARPHLRNAIESALLAV
ncbi:hypothetical protein OG562_07660 [Streptomyces sp. NBC_01275]|uniref:hypothetical protein n=1 Tax=Streptomyces sp. NBC_01275 TaxID=2903807 RepID=UPI00224C81C9|nr:hypothetical protein [Streptomyces sp. NBC_01275]MCX4760844.1 hypothetical protein [Streptomyces sp. NBC_01275]